MLPITDLLNNAAAARSAADNPGAILQRFSGAAGAKAASSSTPAKPGQPGEFERLFPGAAANRAAPAANPSLSGQLASAQLRTTQDIQAEVALDPERKRLYNAALDFQGIFIGKMLKSMRSNLNPEADLLFGGNRQQIFQDMLYDEYSKSMSRSGGFDLADQMYRQLSSKLPPVPGSQSATSAQSDGGRVSAGRAAGRRAQLPGQHQSQQHRADLERERLASLICSDSITQSLAFT